MPSVITIMLVDDHAVVRAGYKRYIELDPAFSVVAEAATGEEAYEQLLALQVDLVIMDLSMPGQGGFETLRRMLSRFPRQKVLIFSMHENPSIARQVLELGAAGYLTKSMQPDDIIKAIHQVMAGQRPVATSSIDAEEKDSVHKAQHTELLPREFEVLLLLADGHSVEVVAEKLHLSVRTAANYQSSIRKKLRLTSHFELRRYVEQHGLLSSPLPWSFQ